MIGIGTIFTGISTVEKILPVVEQVAAEIGPVVKTEIADGEAVWSAVEKALADLRAAFATVKSVTAQTSK